MWVGTGENNWQRSVTYGDGVYRYDDAGKTWKRMGLDKSEHIARIRRRTRILFAHLSINHLYDLA